MIAFGLAAVPVAVGLVLLWRHGRAVAERESASHHVRFILADLHNYSFIYDGLPPAVIVSPTGQPLRSWRLANAALLFGDPVQRGYYGQSFHRDRPWDAPENRCYRDGPHRDYPGGPLSYIDPTRPGDKARFVAIVGPGTAFDPGQRRRMEELPGGLVVFTEATGCEAHWMEPGGDLDPRTMPRRIGAAGGIGPVAAGGTEFWVGFADHSVRLLRADVPFETLAPFLTIEGAALHDRDGILAPYTVRSW